MQSNRVKHDARALVKATGIPYQEALKKIRRQAALDEASAQTEQATQVHASDSPTPGVVLPSKDPYSAVNALANRIIDVTENPPAESDDASAARSRVLSHQALSVTGEYGQSFVHVPKNRDADQVVEAIADMAFQRRGKSDAAFTAVLADHLRALTDTQRAAVAQARAHGVFLVCPATVDPTVEFAELPEHTVTTDWLNAVGITSIADYTPAKAWSEPTRPGLIAAARTKLTAAGSVTRTVRLEFDDHPLGVISGVVGTGKHTLLRTLIASTAVTRSPQDVGFFLVTSTVGRFDAVKDLPHMRGFCENATTLAHAGRALFAAESELTRRVKRVNELGCDWRGYRERHTAGESGYEEPWPELLIVLDEMYDVLRANRQLISTLNYLASQTHDLGVRVVWSSQFIDDSLFGNLSVGFSYALTASDVGHSRRAIGTVDAVHLPKGSGQALLKAPDGLGRMTVVRVTGLDSSAPVGGAPADEQVFAHLRGVEGLPALLTPSLDTPIFLIDPNEFQSFFDDGNTLVYRSKFNGLLPVLSGVNPTKLQVPVGDLDDVRNARRAAFDVDLSDNGLIVGDAGSGKSTTLMTMVATSARVNGPAARWLLIDGRKRSLFAVQRYPNVAAYVNARDADKVARVIGEAENILDEREAGAEADQWLVLAIDDAEALLGGDEGVLIRNRLLRLAELGPKHRVVVVATAPSPEAMTFKLSKHLPVTVALRMSNPVQLSGGLEFKSLLKALPDQPGRAVDPKSHLAALIAFPASSHTGGGVTDYGKRIAAAWDSRLTPVDVEVGSVTQERLRSALSDTGDVPPRDRRIALGLNVSTCKPVFWNPRREKSLVIGGGHGSGKTTALRGIIGEIVERFTLDEARIVIVDPSLGLIGERDALVERGYLKAENYAVSTEEITDAMSRVSRLLRARTPSAVLPAEQVADRSWFTGPEVFVIADDYQCVSDNPAHYGPMYAGLHEARKELRGHDLGVRFAIATIDKGFTPRIDRDRLLSALAPEAYGALLMLSGDPSEMSVGPNRLRFEKRRAGRGVYDTPHTVPVTVQTTAAAPSGA